MKDICFTGHRQIKITSELKTRLLEVIENLIELGAENFYAGGALGWDTLCALTVLELKKTYPNIKLNLVLPCPANQQTERWNKADKETYQKILLVADNTEICSPRYDNQCMAKRNQRLIDLSEVCICYLTNEKSGTGQTVRKAKKKGIKIINLAIE